MKFNHNHFVLYLATTYVNNSYLDRWSLWALLAHLRCSYKALWMFVRDFNALLSAHEKRGEFVLWWLPTLDKCLLVNSLIHPRGFNHLGIIVGWREAFMALRLDTANCNDMWMTHSRQLCCYTLVKHWFDHHPNIIYQENNILRSPHSFKFYKTWFSHSDCFRVIVNTWIMHAKGKLMQQIM